MTQMLELVRDCSPSVSPVLMAALVRTESAWRPYAIGMDRAEGTVSQPGTLPEAVAAAKALAASGRQFSVGLAQIHISHVRHLGLSWEQAFDPCLNLALGQKILWEFYHRATASGYVGVGAVWAALRGYNSGGVHYAKSDDYASRIFGYISARPSGADARSDPLSAPKLPAPIAGQRRQAGHKPRSRDVNESPDIFERQAAPPDRADIAQVGPRNVGASTDNDLPTVARAP